MKKLFSLLMALMMLAVPTLSLADADALLVNAMEAGRRAETTVTLSMDGLPVDDSIQSLLDDILGVLKLVSYTQHGENAETGLTVNLNDRDILTGAFALRNDVLYLQSNLLGEQAVAASAEDIVPLIGRFIDLLVLMEAMDADEAEMYKALIEEGMSMAAAELSNLDMEIDWSETDFTGFMTVLENVLNNAEVEAVTMQPRNCDPATEKGRIVLTGADMLALWNAVVAMLETTPDLTELFDAMLAESGATTAELLSEVTGLVEQLTAFIPDGLILDLYVNNDGELVSMTVLLEIAEAGQAPAAQGNVVVGRIGEAATMQNAPAATAAGKGEVLGALGAQYTRLTTNEGVAHAATVEMDIEGEMLTLSLNVLGKANGVVVHFGMAMDGENVLSMALSADSETQGNIVRDTDSFSMELTDGFDVYNFALVGEVEAEMQGADVHHRANWTLNVGGMDLLTLHTDTQTMEPVAAIDMNNALYLARISEEEFQSWFVNVVNGLQFQLVGVLQALPTSVLQLVLGQ